MSDDVRVLPMVPGDLGEVLTLQRAAYATEAQLYGDPFLPALTQTLEQLRVELAAGTGFVARLGPRLVGAVRTETRGAEVHIGRLTVAPDLQGRGIGSRLLTTAEAAFPGARTAVLFTGHRSATNLTLYERHGYTESHREPLTPDVELVYLSKPLGH